jgi:PAS domain S-box-containing protein
MRKTTPALAHSALDAAPDAMLIIDASGIIHFTNQRVSALFGYAYDEIIGESIGKLMPESVCAPLLQASGELSGRRRNGTDFPVEISLSPIDSAEDSLVEVSIRDATARKHMEAELIVARQLADQSREMADRANRSKSRFLATASHDLRQPLQTLEFLNGTMRRLVTDHTLIEALSQQGQAIDTMSRLLNALLDISKLESGAIKPEPVDFNAADIFGEMELEFGSIAAKKGLRLEIETCNEAVYSDPSLVEQILRNLVSNAIKYTREGRVRLRCVRELALVRIEVFDTGVGIPADQLPNIYDEFYQVGVPSNSTRDGYGLGLSIVYRLVKLLKANLDVRSEVGRGSTFSLILPASIGRYVAPRPASSESPVLGHDQNRQARVLLVEDDASVRSATCLLLELEGYHVTPVASQAEAVEHILKGHRVDLVISDYHLAGGESGTEVIAKLREILGVSLKAILTTGDTSSAIKRLPCDSNLRITSKPVKAEELLTLLDTLLAA